ncbi:hypothetical protein DCAR_0205343 [Daucus carota subsp. sativus]|uniref:Uncharacterized protein n=1 Tax=Daucus carota subsp. sativus TaxID=79200 RepID=A0A166CJV2_DAUCS|nr:hypothetical protein DCAR_0205343 [Daucus carota subsp. sativus]
MSSLESSTKQNADDANQASSQPKIMTNEVLIDPVAQSLEQEKDETKLANQVIEPMSRDNEKETQTLEENAVKTKSTEVAEDARNLTRDNSGLTGIPLLHITILLSLIYFLDENEFAGVNLI